MNTVGPVQSVCDVEGLHVNFACSPLCSYFDEYRTNEIYFINKQVLFYSPLLQVCESKDWAGIYKELTDMHTAKSGHVAKHYYERLV